MWLDAINSPMHLPQTANSYPPNTFSSYISTMTPLSIHGLALLTLALCATSVLSAASNWFNASSVLVLRVGNGVAFASGTAAPLFFDEL